jgi:hypothetical protein
MQAVAILIIQLIWAGDFLLLLILGRSPLALTAYMFDPNIPLFTRVLSSFHGWMPFLLLYLLSRTGYHRGAWKAQCIIGPAVFLVCYCFTAPPPAPSATQTAVNINYVFGLSNQSPQSWMHPLAWLGLLMVLLPAGVYWPTHWGLGKMFKSRGG